MRRALQAPGRLQGSAKRSSRGTCPGAFWKLTKAQSKSTITKCWLHFGPFSTSRSVPFYPLLGEGSPTKIDYGKGHSHSSLSTGGPSQGPKQIDLMLVSPLWPILKDPKTKGQPLISVSCRQTRNLCCACHCVIRLFYFS